jgi:hypothetical protein
MTAWLLHFDAQQCMSISLVLAALAAMSGSLHQIFIAQEYQPSGLFSWTIRRRFHPIVYSNRLSGISWLPDALASHQAYWALLVVQLACSVLVLLPAYRSHRLAFLSVLLAIQIAGRIRNGEYGTDESSALQLFLLAGLTVYSLPVSMAARILGIWFIAVQILLSYFTCGVTKLLFPIWRNGSAIEETLGTTLFGNRSVQRFIRATRVGRPLSWSVLVFECAFPLIIVLNPVWCLLFLVLGICFHLTIAAVMGLNSFLFPVIGCYPSLLYLCISLHRTA